NTHAAFAVERMIGGLAWAAGRDRGEFRVELLEKPSPGHARVLQLAADKAGWGTPPPRGRARGVAVHESFGSIMAQVAEVSVDSDRSIRVHHVTCAVDCGQTINPLGIEAQVQGAIAYGLSAVLY